MNPPDALLVVLSGDAEKLISILGQHCAVKNITAIRVDERLLSDGKSMMSILRKRRESVVAFGCGDLRGQRFQFFMKLYLLWGLRGRRWLIDESGTGVKVHWGMFIVRDLPMFLVELAVSTATLVLSFLHLTVLQSTHRLK